MSNGESHWIERAQSAEAQLKTLKHAYEPAIQRIQQFKANFGVRERSNGELVIDFEKFVAALGLEGALQLREEIDRYWKVTGEYGEKPRVRVGA